MELKSEGFAKNPSWVDTGQHALIMKQINFCPQCGNRIIPTEDERFKLGGVYYDCFKCGNMWKIV